MDVQHTFLYISLPSLHGYYVKLSLSSLLGSVYMRKLVLARVSYWDDFLISYRVYTMTAERVISYLVI